MDCVIFFNCNIYWVMKMSVIVYVNKNYKKSINDIFLLIRKGDGINDRYENCYEKLFE